MNRRIPNGTYGGVRGRGLVTPPTRLWKVENEGSFITLVLPGKKTNSWVGVLACKAPAGNGTDACTREIAAFRKNKMTHNVNVIYQAVRKHYNLSIQQDSAANIKSVLDHLE